MADDIVIVRRYSSQLDAVMDSTVLEAEGIRTMIMSDDCGGMLPGLQVLRGACLMVHKDDEDRARELLEDPHPIP